MASILKDASRKPQSDNAEKAKPREGDDEEEEAQLLHLSDEVLLIISYQQPQDTSSLLLTCKAMAKRALAAWKAKVDAMADEFILPFNQDTAASEDTAIISEAQHWNIQLRKRYQRLTRYRPTIERWGEPPHWYPDHPEPSSPFHSVRRAHDVTDFRLIARTGHLEPGTYVVSWRVNSTSGFCDLQLDATWQSHPASRLHGLLETTRTSVWNSRVDRGSGWKEVEVFGIQDTLTVIYPGGAITARMWKRELDFTGGIQVDCLIVKRVPDAIHPTKLIGLGPTES